MTPLPPPLGTGKVIFWRLDAARFAHSWASGEGSFRVGGRWNGRGQRVVYASLDPSTGILEVAVHKGFRVLDTVSHTLTRARLIDPGRVHVVRPEEVRSPHWLHPGQPSAGQREFGAALLAWHDFVVLPSAVSTFSWHLLFDPSQAEGLYDEVEQVFADTAAGAPQRLSTPPVKDLWMKTLKPRGHPLRDPIADVVAKDRQLACLSRDQGGCSGRGT